MANRLFFDMKPKGGQTDIEELEESADPDAQRLAREMVDADAARRAMMSPPGALNLPPRLEAKRIELGMIDNLFRQATFHRVFVWQLPGKETYGESGLAVPLAFQKYYRQSTPIGVIISAGAIAMDHLWSHGIEVGDTANFVRLSPKRILVDAPAGTEDHYIVCVASDIIGSQELDEAFHEGRAKYVWDEKLGKHVLEMDGKRRVPSGLYTE